MKRNFLIGILACIALVMMFGSGAVRLYTDWLWFLEVGYQSVFLKILITRVELCLAVAVVYAVILAINIFAADFFSRTGYVHTGENTIELPVKQWLAPRNRAMIFGAVALLSLFIGLGASVQWETFLVWRNAVPFNAPPDPVFGRDISFYIFKLPWLSMMCQWLLTAVFLSLVATVGVYAAKRGFVIHERGVYFTPTLFSHVSALLGCYLALRAWQYRLDAYSLLTSSRGVVQGVGYADLHVRLPILTALTALCIGGAAVLWFNVRARSWKPPAFILGLLIVASLAGWAVPGVVQHFGVTPSEKNLERPFISRQIRYTRHAYGLVPGRNIIVKPFEAQTLLSPADVSANEITIRNIRLWDPRPLLQSYQQLQAIRPYYKFNSVRMDRYRIGGAYTQVTIAPRELDYTRLPDKSWINQRFTYTHGYGLCVSPVTDIVEEGRPNLLLRDIPPVSSSDLKVREPRIYFGELSNEYVFVNARVRALDYPEGGSNKPANYRGRAGIRVSTFWRRLAFAVRFGSKDILFSSNIDSDTRILLNRNIMDRARRVLPLLNYDKDPYIVIDARGRLKWIQDAYTVSGNFPYAEQTVLKDGGSFNYIRNAVKVTVDANDGDMRFYVSDPEDPIVRTYMKIFPGVFHPMEKMPDGLIDHVRYPVDLFNIQAKIFSIYQMEDPGLFYEKEDRWMLPTEMFEDEELPMEPYYTLMRLPGEKSEEFVLMMPFTPNGRQNLSAWMCARNDFRKGVYGKLLVYRFPAQQKNIYGPMQVEARIMQNADIAQQIGLWKRETQVIRGNLIVIPIEKSLLYVEPVYLKARSSEIPELKRVIAVQGDRIAMDTTLVGAIRKVVDDPTILTKLFNKEQRFLKNETAAEEQLSTPAPLTATSAALLAATQSALTSGTPLNLAREALTHLQNARKSSGDWDWNTFGGELNDLEKNLNALVDALAPAGATAPVRAEK